MSLESVRAFLAEKAPDITIVELENSTATVALAAEGHGVAPAQIAKTFLVFKIANTTTDCGFPDAQRTRRRPKAACLGRR